MDPAALTVAFLTNEEVVILSLQLHALFVGSKYCNYYIDLRNIPPAILDCLHPYTDTLSQNYPHWNWNSKLNAKLSLGFQFE